MLGKRTNTVSGSTKVIRQTKKARLDSFVSGYLEKDNDVVQAFMSDCQTACSWCTKEYKLYLKIRLLGFVAMCENIERDCLYYLGGSDKDREYMAKYHPHEDCTFASNRFVDFSMVRNSLVPRIIAKGLCAPSVIRSIIKGYITHGRYSETYLNIVKNQYRPIEYNIQNGASMGVFGRIINHYIYTRKRFYQTNTDCVDTGLLTIQLCLNYVSDKNMKVYIGPHSIATPATDFEKYDYDVDTITFRFPMFYFSTDEDECYHTADRLEHILAFVDKLTDYFNVRVNLRSCLPYRCDCEDAKEMPVLPESHTVFPVKGGQLMKYDAPKGLAGLCLDKMKNEWDWRTHNVESFLTDHPILKQHFY